MGLLAKIKNWWRSLFPKPETATPSEIKETTPAVEISRTPGLKCPECGTRMIVSIQNLINLEPVHCPGCGLELTIDAESSQSALESLRKLQSGLDEAARVKQKSII
jgi:DNA-directed RNA polymerase subunit RPC12/RpoP